MKPSPSPLRRLMCIFWMVPGGAAHAAPKAYGRADVIQMVERAVAMHKERGKAATLAAISQTNGPFHRGELYVFAYDTTGKMLAHPVNPKLIGKNLLDVPDISGKLWRRTIQELAARKGSGWVDYTYKNPVSGRNEPKSTYIQKVDDVIYCCGIYL
jgi:cytochrome c